VSQTGKDANASKYVSSVDHGEFVPSTGSSVSHDPYLALRFRNGRLFILGTFVAVVGQKMTEVAIGWELYERTGSAFILGLVGLVLVIPVFFLSLPAGHASDYFNRKRIVLGTQVLLIFACLGLAGLSSSHGSLILVFACLLLMGGANAFSVPASGALLSQLVPEHAYENIATWNSSAWQFATVLGPALGGFVIAIFQSATLVYVFNAVAGLILGILLLLIHEAPRKVLLEHHKNNTALYSLAEGFIFLRRTQIILAAITLDMFAVLLGGATTLLPIFAKDILQVGPVGLGWMRAAPAMGAVCIGLVLAHRPPFKKAGRTLLLAVIGFGIATIVFGLSRSFWLSLLMLFLLGGLDNISVVIRAALLLMRTPDEMRGRIAAVNGIFLGASNELGGFESGLTAQLFGPTLSVVLGGIGTILVVLLVAWLSPELRCLTTLRDPKLDEAKESGLV
jgi:MFS family permease